jgi:hypothetical protein
MAEIYQIFNNPFFVIVGGLFTLSSIVVVLLTFAFWVLGITPLLWRLGLGRWTRKVAIVAKSDMYSVLEKDLTDSGVFRRNNVTQITNKSLSDVKNHSLLLVHYQSFTPQEIEIILNNKNSEAGMIFYFPSFSNKNGESIPNEMRDKISNTPNTTIVNFRGRLLNDLVTTLITTSYEKR